MKILSSKEIYEADRRTYKSQMLTTISLMERAAQKCVDWIVSHYSRNTHITIYAGPGNNGGDGLAMARLLYDATFEVDLIVVGYASADPNDDVLENLRRLVRRDIQIHYFNTKSDIVNPKADSLIIDCLFGIGIKGAAKGLFKSVIDNINELDNSVVSIDLPSGLFAQGLFDEDNSIIHADHTLTLQAPKLNFLLAESGRYVGYLHVIDINLDLNDETEERYSYFDHDEAIKIHKSRERFTHKGTYGHSLIIGGKEGMMGSVILATKAALRSGSGMVSCFVPRCGLQPIQVALPEAIVLQDKGTRSIHEIALEKDYEAVGIGVGMGQGIETKETLLKYLKGAKHPIVLDADALNLIASTKNVNDHIPEGCVITPHPKEFERLVGPWNDGYQKLDFIRKFAKDNKCVVVFKDAYTIVCDESGIVSFNSSGNSGMATAGSGDVLTGIITGLLAQGYEPLNAAKLGVYIHGKAGDIAAEESSQEALISSDLLDNIGNAFRTVSGKDFSV